MNDKPSDEAIMERTISLAREYLHAVILQNKRLQTKASEDNGFVFKWWIDLQFLILALYRFRNMVGIAKKIPAIETEINSAIEKFDKNIPELKTFRDIGEHMADYAIDNQSRHEKSINRKHLQVGTFNGNVYEWLDRQLNIVDAERAAKELYQTLQTIKNNFFKQNSKFV